MDGPHMTVGGNGTREGTKLQREAGGNQGTRKGGDSNRSRDQEYSRADQDVPVHIQSTVASQSKVKINFASMMKPDASAPKVCIKCFIYSVCLRNSQNSM